MATANDILDRLGGLTSVARELSERTGRTVPLTTVQGWRDANYFPEWRRDALIALAAGKGVDLTISEFPTIDERRPRVKVAA